MLMITATTFQFFSQKILRVDISLSFYMHERIR